MKIVPVIFLLSITLSMNAQKHNQSKYFPLGVCQKADNSQLVRTMGFDYIECGVESFLAPAKPEEIFQKNLELIHKSGIALYACNGFIPGTMKTTGPEFDQDKVLEYARIALQRAKIAGIKIIVFGSGTSRNIPEGFDKQKARDQFIELLRQIGPIAKENNVTIAIEPLRSQECNFINTVKEACEISRVVNHRNIRVLADFFHMNCEGETPESIVQAGKLLVHCHIAEKEKRAAPGVSKEDFTQFYKALHQINYKGKVSIECSWVNFEKEAPEAIRILKSQQDELSSTK